MNFTCVTVKATKLQDDQINHPNGQQKKNQKYKYFSFKIQKKNYSQDIL